MLLFDVVELVSGEIIRPCLPADKAYRVRDQHQEAMLRTGRSLKRKRYGVRPAEFGSLVDFALHKTAADGHILCEKIVAAVMSAKQGKRTTA